MNVSLPFASPARKQDTTNNNKKGQPHDTNTWQTGDHTSIFDTDGFQQKMFKLVQKKS